MTVYKAKRTDVEGTHHAEVGETGHREWSKTHSFRAIGYVVHTWDTVVEEKTEEEMAAHYVRSWMHHEGRLGLHYAMSVTTTRNGMGYGATQPDRLFETRLERDKAIQKYIAGTTKRAAKREAKTAPKT